jgi:hypothetical protein
MLVIKIPHFDLLSPSFYSIYSANTMKAMFHLSRHTFCITILFI